MFRSLLRVLEPSQFALICSSFVVFPGYCRLFSRLVCYVVFISYPVRLACPWYTSFQFAMGLLMNGGHRFQSVMDRSLRCTVLPDDKTKYYSNGIRACTITSGRRWGRTEKKAHQLLEREFVTYVLMFSGGRCRNHVRHKSSVLITHEQLRIPKENPPNQLIGVLQRRREKTPMSTTRQEERNRRIHTRVRRIKPTQ